VPKLRNDLDLYERYSDEWWDPRSSAFRSLRATKGHHLDFLARTLPASDAARAIVDLGCGGGLLSVPLARRGDRLVGVDLSPGSVVSAQRAADRARLDARFVQGDARRAPVSDACADLVLLSDVLEHVDDPRALFVEAARLVRPGGHLFTNTINSTRRAHLLAVTVAEGLGLVPRGTHDPALFVAPRLLDEAAAACGLERVAIEGEAPRLGRTIRTWTVHLRASRSLAVSYCALFRRPAALPTSPPPAPSHSNGVRP